jgi:hypothetical protein
MAPEVGEFMFVIFRFLGAGKNSHLRISIQLLNLDMAKKLMVSELLL